VAQQVHPLSRVGKQEIHMTTATATQTYASRRSDIARLIRLLEDRLEKHAKKESTDPKNWEFAGSLGYVREELIVLVATISNTARDKIEAKLNEEIRTTVEMICDRWARKIGWGWHPDTPGRDYFAVHSGMKQRTLTNDEADEYDRDMMFLFGNCPDHYQAGMDALRRLDALRKDYNASQSWDRERCIAWLESNDQDGDYNDEAATAQGMSPLTLQQARELVQKEMEEHLS